ncbi:putative homing endonuclease [Dickeya phage Coodle]|uniref:NUMOD3 motif family protein n=3 Tax=Aglimvirinae TaxID=2169530 RepID=A0A075E0E6_9CAUD|nr:homing endonuclease [Dickeya phage RC-2014]AHZ60270.1 NUMOD3 motif family protein [Dickeya phage RC-2014]AIM51687.1 NUMOD3 motif family protein [Dickeya phage phiDP10.3]AYN55527.1 putative homing endonuclease [Dickeya phage Coodle]
MAYQNLIDILRRDYPEDTLINRYVKVLAKGVVNDQGEVHHILPKSLYPSFREDPKNLIRLSSKAHFVCHLLLWKITKTREMLFAFNCMRNSNGIIRTSRLYQESKIAFYSELSVLTSERMKVDNPMFRESTRKKLSERNKGLVISAEQRLKSSVSLKKTWKERGHPRSGAVVSQETRDKISASNSSQNTGELNPFYGRTHSEESKKLMRERKSSLMPWEMNRFNEQNIPFYLKSDLIYEAWRNGVTGICLCRQVFGDERYINSIQPITKRFQNGWVPSVCPKWLEWRSHHGI